MSSFPARPLSHNGRRLFATPCQRIVALLLAISIILLALPREFTHIIPAAQAASTSVVISEFRTRGPAGGNDEFVELYNLTNAAIDIGGWKINGSNNTAGVSTRLTITAGTMIPARGHFLATNSNTSGPYSGSVPGNQTYATGITDDGGIALFNASNVIIDQVGMSTGSAYKEGTVLAQLATNVDRCYERKPGGTSGSTQDSDNNSADFQLLQPCAPQNLSSTPTPGSTNPTGVGNANPSSVAAGDTTLLTVTVTPGTNPTSTAHTVSADLSAIGGSNSQTFFNDGSNGDVTANDNVFSFSATVASGTSGGAKSLPVTITETAPNSRTGNTTISLTVLAPTNPTGTGSANPNSLLAGKDTVLTVNVTPGANPASTGLAVTADLSSIGGSSTQAFSGSGNTFTFTATVAMGTTPGVKTLPVQITDAQNRSGSTTITLTVESPPPPVDHIVISQIYGGGGNSGATYRNDYVELYNPTTVAFDLGGWTVQYGAATGDTWQTQPLGGVMQPGEYYLISLASGGATGAPLPDANVVGSINMSGTTGKVALSNAGDPFSGCPVGDATLVDLVGYGTNANCREGSTNAPAPSNTTALFRKSAGLQDTNVNSADFVTGAPNPRRTTPIVEIGPYVLSVDPRSNATSAPRDASISVTFTEPVTVNDAWYNINCVTTGLHNDATVAVNGRTWVITPNTNFVAGEQCSVTIDKDFIHDEDLDDSAPDSDTLKADYSWTFTVATGTAPPYGPEVHLTMGNPNGATADINQPDNYLMMKPEYALSYNRERGGPNWVSWHLSDEWIGDLTRVDTFRPDPAVPSDWYRVQAFDFTNSGFDRGHMVPNADRDKETSIPINQATFLMSNMLAQAPDNNQGPWANMEGYLRTLLPANEIYIVAGGAGVGGTGSGGFATTTAGGHVTVPAQTWKVALVIPKADGDDVSRVTCGTRTIAVIMPNTQGIRNVDWQQQYIVSVDQVEALTGYDFFSNLPDAVEHCVEAGINGSNPPGTAGQSVTTNEDTAVDITLTAVSPNNNTLTYTIVSGPTNGVLSGSGANRTYTPNANYSGPDSFTFKVNDGTRDSNTSTVSITVNSVNDGPDAVDDDATVTEDSGPNTVNVLINDTDTEGDTLSITAVTQGTNGSVVNNNSSVSYTPNANFFGTDTFTYTVSDGNGGPDTATVNVTVTNANDDPTATDDSATIAEDSGANAINVLANDTTAPDTGETLTITAKTDGAHGTVVITGGGTGLTYTPNANHFGSDSFTYTISDGNGGSATATVNVTVTNVNDPPDAVDDSATLAEDSGANTVNVLGNDTFAPDTGETLSIIAKTDGTHGTVAITGGGTGLSYTPAANYFGPDSFTYTISDGNGGTDTASVSVTVTNVNDAPVAVGDSYVTNSNTTLNVPAPGVLANDTDIDSSLTAQLVSNVAHGTLTLNADGSFTYAPSLNYTGPDSFTYRAFDGTDGSNVVTVSITVNDTVPPVINSSVAVTLLSPASSDLVNVGLTATATDNSGGPVTIQVAVFGNEDDQTATLPGVVHSPDARDIAPNTLRLRAERVEANDGRVYLIIVTATDSVGNVSRNYHTVVVPKNNKQASINSVNAQAAAAIAYSTANNGAPPPGYFVIGDGATIGPKQ